MNAHVKISQMPVESEIAEDEKFRRMGDVIAAAMCIQLNADDVTKLALSMFDVVDFQEAINGKQGQELKEKLGRIKKALIFLGGQFNGKTEG